MSSSEIWIGLFPKDPADPSPRALPEANPDLVIRAMLV